MKAITIHQPWATLIVTGHKTVENRWRTTHHRGPLAIHAGKKIDDDAMLEYAHLLPERHELVLGAIIGQVQVYDSVPVEAVPESMRKWGTGPWCWLLRCARRLPRPIACRGRQNLFEVVVP